MFEDIPTLRADFVQSPPQISSSGVVDPARAVMLEILRGIHYSHERGMTTVLVVRSPGRLWITEAVPPHIDFVTTISRGSEHAVPELTTPVLLVYSHYRSFQRPKANF